MRALPRSTRWLIVSTIALNALVFGASVLAVRHNLKQAEQQAHTSARNILVLLRQQITDSFQKIDIALLALAQEAGSQARQGLLPEPAALNDSIERYRAQLPDVESIRIADAEGQVFAGTGVSRETSRNITDRDHFRRARKEPGNDLIIGLPTFSRINQKWGIPLTRRINLPDGRFAGVLNAYVTLDTLQRLFANVDVGPHGSIVLRDSTMALVARHPASDQFLPGQRTISAELQIKLLSDESGGVFRAVNPVDGIERIVVFGKLDALPYYLLVGRAPQDYLEEWRRDAWLMALLAALFLAVSVTAVWFIHRQGRAREAALQALGESRDMLSGILENVGASVFVKDSDYRYRFANRAVLEFAGVQSLDDMIGRTDAQIRPPETAARLHEVDQRVLEDGRTLRTMQLLESPDGRTKHTLAVRMPMRRPDGSIHALCGISTDVTELVRTQQREKLRGEVLEMMAHHHPLPLILEALARGIEAEGSHLRCAITLIDEDTHQLQTLAAPKLPQAFCRAMDSQTISFGMGCCGHAVFTGESMVVEDIDNHPFWTDLRQAAGQAGVRSCWCEPIRLSDDQVIGTVCVFHTMPALPQADDAAFITSITRLAGIAIERHRTDTERQIASEVFETSQEGIMVTDAEDRIITVNPAFSRITGYSRQEAVGRRPNLLSSGRQDAAFYQAMWDSLKATGIWQGELWNRRKNGDLYVQWLSIHTVQLSDGRGLRRIALFSDITQKKEADDLVWRHANFDLLTSLPNRRLFFDRLRHELVRAQRDAKQLALLFIDLDHFKRVNDTLGHASGDQLLLEVARRLQHNVRESDTVARLGGDEFTVILPEIAQRKDIDRVAQLLIEALTAPFDLEGQQVHISASIGITVYPDDGLDAHALLRNADQAMYAAKELGRNNFCYFTATMQQEALQRQYLLDDLREALDKNQFELAYQPIIDLAGGRISKVEALLRWQHPRRGRVSPADFIPLAEESKLIHRIGDWVFRQAMHDAQGWLARTGVALQTSVNVSPVQFASDDFPHQWMAHLQASALPGATLAVEITEGVLIHHHPEVERKLDLLRQAGVAVAIDDFGTGYSSLSYIKRFDIDVLKIDQSFVRDMANDLSSQALVEAMIVMAHKIGLQVVAEGVETQTERDLLVALGCDFAQGYFFSRPIPATELENLLRVPQPVPID